jgi:serine/threonine protein kinase
MNDFSHICPNCCMESGDGGGYCPVCGIDAASIKNEEFCIPAGSVLLDRYYVGKVIGQGGFGITYLGYDAKFKTKIALKEYFPHGYAFREIHKDKHTVYSLSGDKTEFYNRGIEKFIAEARRLAQFSGAPGIVNVRDYFSENNTAYIVMEFVEGQPLADILEKRGRLSEAEVTAIFLPIIKTLQKVHAADILHRDIAPDNIMVEPDGTARLIDFGASAEVDESAATSAAVIKHFYVPEEQYDSNRRRQGAWTDVYALCATIFRALEGANLPDALERLRGMPFDGFTVPVSAPVKAAVIHGLALFQKDRAQNVEELLEAFSGVSEGTSVYQKPKKDKTPKTTVVTSDNKPKSPKLLIAVLSGVAAIAAVCLIIFLPRGSVPTGGELETDTTIAADDFNMSGNVQTADEAVAATGAAATTTAATTTARTTTAPIQTTTAATTAPETYVENRQYTVDYIGDYKYYGEWNGGRYTGEWENGKPEGKGVLIHSNGTYDGEWKNGLPNGEGTFINNREWEREYTGSFVDGIFNGFGVMVNEDGHTYEGEWKDGVRNGKGSEYHYVSADDEYAREGKNWISTGEFVDNHYVPNSEYERLIYEKSGGVRTEYYTAAPSGDHMLGDWAEDPMTVRHNKKINTDGSIDEWDDVIMNGQSTGSINNTHTDPPQ